MKELKATPGPWVIDPLTRPAEVCSIHGLPNDERTNMQGFAYVRGAVGYWGAEEEESMANAHLIAAAPEMYEWIELAIEKLIELEPNDDTIETENVIFSGKALLEKARGEA